MLTVTNVRGVIFDVDETLLDNNPTRDSRGLTLHEHARLQALHEAGKRHNIPELTTITHEQNLASFHDAPTHSLEGAVWHMLFTVGIVDNDTIDPSNKLLLEIVARKDELYETLLRTEAKPIPGAIPFIEWLASKGLADRMAIASTAIRRDIDIFLEIANLTQYFPNERIIAKDNVTHTKPHPEVFDKAFLSLGLPDNARSQVLAFEDHPRGIASAKAAGLFTCGITTVFSHQALTSLEVPPNLVADSFDEFRSQLDVSIQRS